LYGMKHIRIFAAAARAEPQDSAHHQRRKHSRDGEIPIKESQRCVLGQRAHGRCKLTEELAGT
jgi:hypothetical protein